MAYWLPMVNLIIASPQFQDFHHVYNQISGMVKTEPGSKPGEIICRVAEDEKVTMVVMGTRGLGKVRRTIMGSVSDFVVHHAHCPVIVCRQ